ncbi:MAG: hypothetical protein IJL93_08145, partial [Bacteroidales bacterium]|nr:hypothetical protein [Bacteroidales bacterium]
MPLTLLDTTIVRQIVIYMNRNSQIIRTSWIGIVANVFLAGFKAAVGLLANSVAIVMDAVNN